MERGASPWGLHLLCPQAPPTQRARTGLGSKQKCQASVNLIPDVIPKTKSGPNNLISTFKVFLQM